MPPKVIACKVMERELRARMPAEAEFEIFEISEHTRPERLRGRLQEAVCRADGLFDPIYLGYGLCSQAVVGVVAQRSRLHVFRTDDCIGVFLGSNRARRELAAVQPGSYFLSRGWIGDGGGSIFDEYERLERKWGAERGRKVFRQMLAHYRQLVHIVMPDLPELEADREYARAHADQFGLEYREVAGTDELIARMAGNIQDPDIAEFAPGEPITLAAMMGI